jgi:hypothetical protein
MGPTGNNNAFHAQAVVMTLNNTLSVVNALKHERPDDYYKHTATVVNGGEKMHRRGGARMRQSA